MEFISGIVGIIVGSLIGSLIVITILKVFSPKHSIDYQELIEQSKERLKTQKKLGEKLDRLLEEE